MKRHKQNEYTKGKTDTELIEEAKSLYESIYVIASYSAKDLQIYDLLLDELEKRGYKSYIHSELNFDTGFPF